jgi:antitoxin component of RelBE/YafQ-DinJ toxin-antitoxin module
MPEVTMTLSDAEREKLRAMAEQMGLSPEEAGAEFIRLQMMRIANAQSLPEPAQVIPIRRDQKGPLE